MVDSLTRSRVAAGGPRPRGDRRNLRPAIKFLSAIMREAFPMESLLTYLRETRTTAKAFAKLIGLEPGRLQRMLDGLETVDGSIAQRMVDATGGALRLEDLVSGDRPSNVVVDLRSRFASDADEIDIGSLTGILNDCFQALLGGGRRKGDDRLPALAAEAAAHTYLALSTVTTQRGEDRLIQALRPVFGAILEEFAAPPAAYRRLDHEVRRAAELYFLGRNRRRRA